MAIELTFSMEQLTRDRVAAFEAGRGLDAIASAIVLKRPPTRVEDHACLYDGEGCDGRCYFSTDIGSAIKLWQAVGLEVDGPDGRGYWVAADREEYGDFYLRIVHATGETAALAITRAAVMSCLHHLAVERATTAKSGE